MDYKYLPEGFDIEPPQKHHQIDFRPKVVMQHELVG